MPPRYRGSTVSRKGCPVLLSVAIQQYLRTRHRSLKVLGDWLVAEEYLDRHPFAKVGRQQLNDKPLPPTAGALQQSSNIRAEWHSHHPA